MIIDTHTHFSIIKLVFFFVVCFNSCREIYVRGGMSYKNHNLYDEEAEIKIRIKMKMKRLN